VPASIQVDHEIKGMRNMKKVILGSASAIALIAAAPALAQDNTSAVNQTGNGLSATVTQTGSQGTSQVDQTGATDIAKVTQSGDTNSATVDQDTTGATAEIDQNAGGHNAATVNQTNGVQNPNQAPGVGGQNALVQQGSNANADTYYTATVNQDGQAQAFVRQGLRYPSSTNSTVTVDQSAGALPPGDYNYAYVNQDANGSSVGVSQTGTSNWAKADQGQVPVGGSGNSTAIDENTTASLTQSGDNNYAETGQNGSNNGTIVNQIGNNNIARSVQSGDTLTSSIAQTGDGNTAYADQGGTNNSSDIVQNGDANSAGSFGTLADNPNQSAYLGGTAGVTQRGSDNVSSISQLASNAAATVSQDGNT
jgi:hypothetical protein